MHHGARTCDLGSGAQTTVTRKHHRSCPPPPPAPQCHVWGGTPLSRAMASLRPLPGVNGPCSLRLRRCCSQSASSGWAEFARCGASVTDGPGRGGDMHPSRRAMGGRVEGWGGEVRGGVVR